MGGIRMKARGSTVDLIIEDENSGNSELPLEVGEDMNNKLCPPFSLSYICKVSNQPIPAERNKVSNQPIPVESNGGNPFMPKAKMGPQLIRPKLWDGLKSLRKRFSDVPDPDFHLGQLQRFSLRELEIATDYFSSKNIVGEGGFSKVYKGRLADGSLVAVKRMRENKSFGDSQFQTEVQMNSVAVHRNLLCLRGFCMTGTERLLVYPYMANGSLASCLRERPASQLPLDWPTRKRIALGSAKGLSYLNEDCGSKIIHRDVKPANILLDEEFQAVLTDFGLAILMDRKETRVMVHGFCGTSLSTTVCGTSLSSTVCGTIGYIPPEYYIGGRCSEKNDVYGYGIVLLELITGRRAVVMDRGENDGNVHLKYWVERMLKEGKMERVVDSDLDENYVEAEVEQLMQVALLCTQDSPMDRPKMSEVVRMLEHDGLAERWNKWRRAEVLHQEVELVSHPSSDRIDVQTVELSDPNELSEWRKAEVLSQEVELVSHFSSDWIVESAETLQAVELSDPSEPSEWRKAEVLSQEVELVSHFSSDWIVESAETLQAVELSDPSEPSEWRKAEVLRQEVVLPPHPHPNVDSDWVRFFILMGYCMAVKDFAAGS